MMTDEKQSGMRDKVEAFYDAFSVRLLKDYIDGNRRVDHQLEFFLGVLPKQAKNILVIGCGSGEGTCFVARRACPEAKVLGVDISQENLILAETFFSHPRVTYRHADAINDKIEGQYDAILCPDVYEHIPLPGRPALHAQMSKLLTSNGRIVLTVPSPGKQASLREAGEGLQVIDEDVTLEDMCTLAADVGGTVSYFAMVSVWERNDYIHVVIERGADTTGPLPPEGRIPVKGWRRLGQSAFRVERAFLETLTPLRKLRAKLRTREVERKQGNR